MTITLSIGTFVPHYRIDLYMNLLLQDVDRGGYKWNNNDEMKATMLSITPTSSVTKKLNNSDDNSGSSAIVSTTK